MAKEATPNGLLLNDEQRAIIEKYVTCRECSGNVATYNVLNETLVQCISCKELYICTIAEPDMIWLAMTAPKSLQQRSRIMYWRHDDATWKTRRPFRDRSSSSANRRNNRGIAAESLAKARAVHERNKAASEAAAWEQNRAEVEDALNAQGCKVLQIGVAMLYNGLLGGFTIKPLPGSSNRSISEQFIARLKVETGQLVGISFRHECGFINTATYPGLTFPLS